MDTRGYERWEHKIRDMYCTHCGEEIDGCGFRGCEESDHEKYIADGKYNFCPYCSKDLRPGVAKFQDRKIRFCTHCSSKIDHEKYEVPCVREGFGKSSCTTHGSNPNGARFCQWCGELL